MSLQHLIFVLLLYLSVGTFISFGFVKPSEVGRKYFLYHGLGISVLGLLCLFLSNNSAVLIGFIGVSFIYALTAGLNRLITLGLYVAGSAFGIFTIALDLSLPSFLPLLNSLLSSLMLGFTMAAMLLGHWYLVEPKLSIGELRRVCMILIALIGIRFVFGTYSFANAVQGKSEMEIYRFFLSGTPGIFMLMRWFWGLLGPMILAYLIWGTVKIRSTQSATGILYVTVLCVLTGEIMSQYLTFFHGIIG